MIRFTNRGPIFIVLLYGLLAVILRFFSFFPSVIDHDESTYLEIARMILEGKMLYVDMIDIKPPGIFLILAGFQAVFGYSVFIMRLLVSLWIALTAFILYRSALLFIKDERASLAAGIIYIIFISTWSFYGISITPEIFFNLFTISALYVFIKKEKPTRYFWAGLLAGLGFMVKYLVLFDFAAFTLVFLIIEIRKMKFGALPSLLRLTLAGAGFFIPFAITNFWYYFNGHFDALFNIVYIAPSKYPADFEAWKMMKFLLDFHLRFLPLFIFFYYELINKGLKNQDLADMRLLGILWSVLALIAVVMAGKTFGHYTIQLMLPVSLLAALFFHSKQNIPALIAPIFKGKTMIWIMFMVTLLICSMKLEYILKKDIPREIAAYLKPKLNEDDVIYTGNYHHIIYYLLKKDSPTKYIHRSLLINENHIRALNIDVDHEFHKIIAANPLYIIIKNEYPEGILRDFIKANYKLEKDFEGNVQLFRLVMQ